ncbi:hypothetical protein E2986_12292, partial [Frieseomelitta varia]
PIPSSAINGSTDRISSIPFSSLSTSPAAAAAFPSPSGRDDTRSSRFRLTGSDALCERVTTVFRRDTNTTQT